MMETVRLMGNEAERECSVQTKEINFLEDMFTIKWNRL
jgi:hypothetical protein